MIKVTLEYENINEAVIALAKLAQVVGVQGGARSKSTGGDVPTPAPQPSIHPLARTSTRRGRSDKGQARGSYKNPSQNAAAGAAPAPDGSAASNGFATVPDPGKAADEVANPTSTPVGKAVSAPVVAPEPAAPASSPGLTHEITQSSTVVATGAAAPVYTQKDVQEAVANVFKTKGLPVALQVLQRFGANTYRDVLPASYAEFIKHATFVSEGGAV